jgi:hypothetical protein
LGAMGFCNITSTLRGNRVGRDQVPHYTVHVTDGWDEMADISSSWEPCRCRKRPQWAGAYSVENFQKWTSWHGQTYQIHVYTHIYTNLQSVIPVVFSIMSIGVERTSNTTCFC